MSVTKEPIPPHEPILGSLARIDYADAYSNGFESNRLLTIDDVVYAFFDSAPKWVSWLFELRDRIVRVFGIKTINKAQRSEMRKGFRVEEGQTLGLFNVLKKDSNEIWLGDDDTHLSFRVAIQLQPTKPETYKVLFITTVMLHNWMGKAYFLPVRFFHRLVVKAMLRNTVGLLRLQRTSH